MMPNHRNDTVANWFQRNLKKTLAAVTLIFILAIVFAAEKSRKSITTEPFAKLVFLSS